MAPVPQYLSPAEQLRELAVSARADGVPFEAFWMRALFPANHRLVYQTDPPEYCPDAVRWPSDKRDRDEWKEVLAEVKEAWRRAYEYRPAPRSETAAGVMGESLATLELRPGDEDLLVA